MLLKDMFKGVKTDPDFKGFLTTDNMVAAVDISEEQNADVDDYAVVCYGGGTDRSSSLNPEKKTNSYYYKGKSTLKTGNQRTIDFTEDRYIGDEFQDYALSHEQKYATGQAAIKNYVYFNTLTGEGEKGKGSLIISDDGSGAPEENLSISGSIEKSGDNPVKFTYQGFGGYTVLDSSPSDWATKYDSYYERKDGAFAKLVKGSSAPEFAKGKYYSKDGEAA
nr:MAG TPA: hypothetical protein [Caudoviricetes sp.]